MLGFKKFGDHNYDSKVVSTPIGTPIQNLKDHITTKKGGSHIRKLPVNELHAITALKIRWDSQSHQQYTKVLPYCIEMELQVVLELAIKATMVHTWSGSTSSQALAKQLDTAFATWSAFVDHISKTC